MAMSPLPATTSGQPTSAQGSKPAQDEKPSGGFARLFAQAGKTAGGAEGASRTATNRPDDAQTGEIGEHGDADGALTLINDEAHALLNVPPQGNAASALTAEEGSLLGSRGTPLAALLASATTGDATSNGLTSGLASEELAGIQERLDTLARFRETATPNPLGQAIAQVQQGGFERSLLSQANGIDPKGGDLKSTHATLLDTSETLTLSGDNGKSGQAGLASQSGGSNPGNNGGAGLSWTQQLQAQTASPAIAAGAADGGDWLASVSETLTANRSGAMDASSALPLHAGAGLGAGQSAATASVSVAQTPTLSAPLASAEWQQNLGQQLVNLQQRGDQRVQLHLHPAELGPLSIHLKVDDHMAQAQFMSANSHVRAAIEQAIPQLREALGEAGIQLGEAMVGDQQQGQNQDGSADDARRVAAANGMGTSSGPDDALVDGSLGDTDAIAINGVDLYA